MKTKEITQEQISAFADGELADQHIEIALAALRQPEGKVDWEIYHQIGDVLRSDDMAVELSAGFAARMAARLEKEPVIIAPVPTESPACQDRRNVQDAVGASFSKHPAKRWAVPGMAAAAAMVAATFVAAPQLMVASKDDVAMNSNAALVSSERNSHVHQAASAGQSTVAVIAAKVPEGVILRDPRIDEYLLAHQSFSPSVYSTAQYARSATFATEPNK